MDFPTRNPNGDFPINPRRVERKTPSGMAKFNEPWIPYPVGMQAIKDMAALMKRPHEGRPLNLALIGEPNDGKSHLLDFFVDQYPDVRDEDIPRIQILSVEMPHKADGAGLIREMLRATGATFNPRNPPDVLIDKLCIRCDALRIHLYIIDEFHNAAWGRRDASMTLLQAVRSLSNRLRRPFVIAGTTAVNDVLRNDAQLNERFRKVQLPRWSDLQDLMNLLATFEPSLGLAESSGLGTSKVAESILEMAGPKMGRIAGLVRIAAQVSKEKGASRIGDDHWKEAERILSGSKV